MTKPPKGKNIVRHSALFACALAAALAFAPASQAQEIIPADFFSRIPSGAGGDMAVAADTMVFDSRNDTVIAQGNVGISFEDFRATADRAIYYQRTGRVELVGNVAVVDPDGVEYIAERIDLEDGFREGFLRALTAAFPDGSQFTAAETTFDEGVERVYVDGTYRPCGTCIDDKGNTIGWSVKAARIITDEAERVIYFEEPTLQLLGVSVLWLPWLSMPADEDIEFPVLSFDEQYGVGISLPFFRYRVAEGTLAVTPTIYTNQGAGVELDWRQRVGDVSYSVTASGVYQGNPGVYNGLADRNFRGAIQTAGQFTPTDEWTLGWSYTAFTDPAYLDDYFDQSRTTQEVYATYLDNDSYGDIRIQQFVPFDNAADWDRYQVLLDRQALTHPNAVYERIVELADEAGRIELSGRLLGLTRQANHASGFYSDKRYAFGYESQSVHAMTQAAWTNQYVIPGGLVVSPYIGGRLDAANVSADDAGAFCDTPRELATDFCREFPSNESLFSATPIAAVDIRYPLLARTTGATHVIEPIAQFVYREGPAVPGITNDDSQGFVFEDTNLFSFNRFSGADRQETGLRANVGGQFQTNFDNGAWIGGLAGQSFHLAGTNGFEVTDGSTAGIGSGIDTDSSYIVAGLQGGYGTLRAGAKAQIDPVTGDIPRAQLSASGQFENGVGLSANYV
jgi:LPS-assembly protein